ncbi:hypothetical protein EWM64_g4313 [Hericium alpestre]|uniref:F-box domain-containing protein n=1 Tax=Hericium alpestre TaxID=135208 RepID=A0A4Z0A1J9_9AGAM|nr:hypothetical protein EWM64_g4313 [Hericium alpestre]
MLTGHVDGSPAKYVRVSQIMPDPYQSSDHCRYLSTQQDLWTIYLKPRIVQIQGVSLRDDPDVIQLARQKIDDEVAILLNAVSTLRTRRNTFSGIYSLPPEVLGRVFHFLDKKIYLSSKIKLGWIRVTHVCRFWRETALQHPALWSEVTDELGPKWTTEMLLRVKSAPMSYSQCFFKRIKQDKAIADRVIAAHLFHMHHLSIIEPISVMTPILEAIITFPAPILESVCLKGDSSRADQMSVLPSDIFNGHAPILRRLELWRIQVPWSAPILRGLTHLYIDNTHYHPPPTDGDVTLYTQFFRALREMSALEDLYLSNCLPAEPRDPPSIQTVMLPRVQKLTLCSGFTVECAGVVKHLAILPSCDVTVECGLFDPFHFQRIISFVKAHTLSAANQLPLLTMSLSITQGDPTYRDPRWELRFWAAGNSLDLAGLRQDQADVPSISILVDVQEEELDVDLQALCQCLPKDIIRDLVVTTGDTMRTLIPEDWVFILGEYTAVENMSVMGDVVHALCGALGIPRSGLSEGTEEVLLTREQLFLRNLKHIEFEQVDFHHNYEMEQLEDDEEHVVVGTRVYDMLKTSLSRRRAASDIPLTLFIRGCSIDLEQIRGLQEIAEVDWDLFQGDLGY